MKIADLVDAIKVYALTAMKLCGIQEGATKRSEPWR
jgi:hypothetical protein